MTTERIIDNPVENEMTDSFLEYSLSVIVARALPDVRDGLKPVHRRILYGMSELGIRPGTPYKKSARVTGDVIGKYHPHGDSAVYEALVRMAQPWSLRAPLVDGHGNFGSLDDGPAAARYCVVGSTRVLMADGTTRCIGDLAAAEPNTTVDVDLRVVGAHGEEVHASKLHHSGDHPTLRVQTREGYELTGTGNHPVVVLGPDESGKPQLRWALMSELLPGDTIVIRRAVTSPADITAEDPLGVLTGGLVAEGWAGVRVGFNNTDPEYFNKVLDAYDEVVGGARYTSERTLPSGKTIFELDVHDLTAWSASPLAELTGQRSADKRIPECVWGGPAATKRSFLASLFEGDGTVRDAGSNNIAICYWTISPSLARDIQNLLLEFGVVSRRRFHRDRSAWTISITNQRDVRLFAERIGFLTAKKDRLNGLLRGLPDRELGHTKGRLSADKVPHLRDWVLAQTAAPEGRTKGAPGRKWLTKHNFDRIERWERHSRDILDHLTSRPDVASHIATVFAEGYYYATVDSVMDAGVQPVYSLRVDTDEHAFITDGFISHNTECRMDTMGAALLEGLNEGTVDFRPNYDGTETEPEVLPAAFPNLLVNGSQGIAVGMATNMAPHNLTEVVAGLRAMLANPDITLDEMMAHIPGPDLPTGGSIWGLDGIRDGYESGRGTFKMRATAEIGDVSARRKGIIISELPYMVGPERVIAKVKELVNAKRLNGISDIRDHSDRKNGLRVVVECKTGFNPAAVLDELYRLTPLEESFGINNVALVGGEPRTLGLIDLCRLFLDHRRDVVRRRTAHRLAKAEARAHIIEGLLIALDAIDEVVATIRSSKTTETARKNLRSKFKLSEDQATHILDMPLRRLTSLEVTKLRDEYKELQAMIADLRRILADGDALDGLVGDELQLMADTYGDARRTRLLGEVPVAGAAAAALEVPDEPCWVTLTTGGLIGRGAPVASKAKPTKADVCIAALATTTRSTIAAVTDRGRVLRLNTVELPVVEGKAKGGRVDEFVAVASDESVVALLPYGGDDATSRTVMFVTRNGVIKRATLDTFVARTDGISVIALDGDDRLVAAVEVADTDDVIIVTSAARLLRTPAGKVRPQGRTARGVAGMRLDDDGVVIAAGVVGDDRMVAVVTDSGAVKLTPAVDYPQKGRGGGGVRCAAFRKADSCLVAAGVFATDALVATSGGTPVPTGDWVAKRDGSGVATEPAVDGFGFRRP